MCRSTQRGRWSVRVQGDVRCEATAFGVFSLFAAHMAMSMLRSRTVVSVTNTSECDHAAHGDSVESRAHAKKSLPVKAPSRSVCSVEKKSTPPSSFAQPAVSRYATGEMVHRQTCSSPENCCATSEGCGASSTVQLAAKATSKKNSSTIKLSKSPKSMRKNILTNGPKRGEMSSTRKSRNQSSRTATARSDVAVPASALPPPPARRVTVVACSLSSALNSDATSAANEKTNAVVSTRLMWSAQ